MLKTNQLIGFGGRPQVSEEPPPSTWNPSELINLSAWYDASDDSTVIHSGGAVSQLSDKSVNGYHLTQASSPNQPVYDDGTDSITFVGGTGGSGDWLGNGSVDHLNTPTVHAYLVAATGSSGGGPRIISWTTGTDWNNFFYIQMISCKNASDIHSYANQNMSFVSANLGPSNTTKQLFHSAVVDAVHTMTIDGTSGTPVPLGGGATNVLNSGIYLNNGDGQGANMIFNELVYCIGDVTAEEDTELTNYLNTKWSIP